MMTMGAQHALYLIARLFVGAETSVGVEDPGYPDARNIFGMMTAKITPLPVDDQGLIIGEELRRCRLAYVTASQQCPTAVVMPMERRTQLLKMAALHGILLVEDDYGSELIPEDTGLPPLKSLDRNECVIYVGSLSKALAPGLRLGYIVAPAPVIRELRALRRLMLRHPPLNNQRIAALFIGLGHYRSHLAQTTRVMADRARLLDRLLPLHLQNCSFTRGEGSTNYWVICPRETDTEILADKARREGVLIEPGGVFSMDGDSTRHCFRLGFSSIRTDRIETGIQRLGKILA
jgi:GntR family transcriptional regulator/MocR family aminotransferase